MIDAGNTLVVLATIEDAWQFRTPAPSQPLQHAVQGRIKSASALLGNHLRYASRETGSGGLRQTACI